MKLGIFDSGIGGKAVAATLRATFPNADIITVNDHEHVPYGDKTPKEVIRLANTTIEALLEARCDVIVIACNTATAVAIGTLRARYPTQKFIGIEPMIKTAVGLTATKTIAVCATPATLRSDRYQELVTHYAKGISIITPNCSEWAYMIENDQINHQKISQTINEICESGADIIVLGCTHYHWIKDLIADIAAGRAQIIEPSEAIGRRVKQLLSPHSSNTLR